MLETLDLSENELGHRVAVTLENAHLPHLQYVKLSGNGFPLRDVTRLQDRLGDALQELEDNDEDAEFDDEIDDEQDEEVEEEIGAANERGTSATTRRCSNWVDGGECCEIRQEQKERRQLGALLRLLDL